MSLVQYLAWSFLALALSICISYYWHNYVPISTPAIDYDSKFLKTKNSPIKQNCLRPGDRLFSKEELARHTESPLILLGFLGSVYNVTKGDYYHPGGSYHFFAGKDGTRSFLTGDFEHEQIRDDLDNLTDDYLNGLDTWLKLYEEKYQKIGVVVGSYFDQDGCPTKNLQMVQDRLRKLTQKAEHRDDELKMFPPCNSQWDANTNSGRVWCSSMSGGIQRSWIGRPRQFYDLHTKQWRCACVYPKDEPNLDFCDRKSNQEQKIGVKYDDSEQPNCRFKFYQNCDPNGEECSIKD